MPATEEVAQVRGSANKGVICLFHIRSPYLYPCLPVSHRRPRPEVRRGPTRRTAGYYGTQHSLPQVGRGRLAHTPPHSVVSSRALQLSSRLSIPQHICIR